MKNPLELLNTVRAFANMGVIEHVFNSGEFFNGGDFQIRVDQYTEAQCRLKGYDPKSESLQLFCQGKFMDDALREFHFVLNVSPKGWQFQMLQSNLDSWNASTYTYTLPTTGTFVSELIKALEKLK